MSGESPLKHTPAPWAWFTDQRDLYLATPNRGRLFVMSPARKGMQGATIRFARWDGMLDGVERVRMGGIMEDGVILSDGSLHPDAALIASAPSLLAACRGLLFGLGANGGWLGADSTEVAEARLAIFAATARKL